MTSTNNHGVVWLTGLSGAGKTTVAGQLRSKLIARDVWPVMIDGDRMRQIYPTSYGYSLEERRQIAASYGRLALEIASQGHLVICSTISLFHDVHRWNRAHLPNYLEVWLRVPLEEVRRRDTRGVYRPNSAADSPVVGVDVSVEFPLTPDLVIDNYGATTPERAADQILERIGKAR